MQRFATELSKGKPVNKTPRKWEAGFHHRERKNAYFAFGIRSSIFINIYYSHF